LEAHQTLGSKEFLTAFVAGSAAIGAAAIHVPIPIPELVTALGGIVTIGGLLATRSKFISARRKILREHPLSYLYEAGSGPRL
jgi:xanthosine utilization system XapX-like protein